MRARRVTLHRGPGAQIDCGAPAAVANGHGVSGLDPLDYGTPSDELLDRAAGLLLSSGDVRDPAERRRMRSELLGMLPPGAESLVDEAIARALGMSVLIDVAEGGPGPQNWN